MEMKQQTILCPCREEVQTDSQMKREMTKIAKEGQLDAQRISWAERHAWETCAGCVPIRRLNSLSSNPKERYEGGQQVRHWLMLGWNPELRAIPVITIPA